MPISTNYPPLYSDEEMERFGKQAETTRKRIAKQSPIKVSTIKKIPLASTKKPIPKQDSTPKPSFNAMDTVPRNLRTPERSPIFNRAKENLQKGFDNEVWGSPFVKDPNTGKTIERAGSYTEGGWFKPEQRLGIKDVGSMYSYLSSSIRNPEDRNVMLKGLMQRAGATPETEGMGAGLNRALDERLNQAKLASAERIANISAQGGIEESRLLSQGRVGAAGVKADTTTSPKWKQGDDGSWYDENNPLPPPQQSETRLAEDIMARWKNHQGSVEDFYQKLSDEDARIFQKYVGNNNSLY